MTPPNPLDQRTDAKKGDTKLKSLDCRHEIGTDSLKPQHDTRKTMTPQVKLQK